jgi:hypothetical protein
MDFPFTLRFSRCGFRILHERHTSRTFALSRDGRIVFLRLMTCFVPMTAIVDILRIVSFLVPKIGETAWVLKSLPRFVP